MKLLLKYKSFNHPTHGLYMEGDTLEVSEEEGKYLLETWADWFKKVGEGAKAEMKEELEENVDKPIGRPKKKAEMN